VEARTAAQLAKIDRLLGKMLGIHPGVDLFVLPETAVTGYDRERWEQIAEPLPGRISDHFCRKTQELGKWICPGSIVEKDDAAGGMRNTCLLISPAWVRWGS
jgi:predicted amidohydrolase